jgi:hypothetical protein
LCRHCELVRPSAKTYTIAIYDPTAVKLSISTPREMRSIARYESVAFLTPVRSASAQDRRSQSRTWGWRRSRRQQCSVAGLRFWCTLTTFHLVATITWLRFPTTIFPFLFVAVVRSTLLRAADALLNYVELLFVSHNPGQELVTPFL